MCMHACIYMHAGKQAGKSGTWRSVAMRCGIRCRKKTRVTCAHLLPNRTKRRRRRRQRATRVRMKRSSCVTYLREGVFAGVVLRGVDRRPARLVDHQEQLARVRKHHPGTPVNASRVRLRACDCMRAQGSRRPVDGGREARGPHVHAHIVAFPHPRVRHRIRNRAVRGTQEGWTQKLTTAL